jgi:hypothetical protein
MFGRYVIQSLDIGCQQDSVYAVEYIPEDNVLIIGKNHYVEVWYQPHTPLSGLAT